LNSPIQVAVIGGGICGLTCAWRLQRLGVSVLLLESQERVGGVIGTEERNGFRMESGPQSFLGTPSVMSVVRDLGIETELLQANPRAPRYVFARGRLKPIPMSPPALLTSSLLSIGSRYRLVSEAFRRTKPPGNDESVADFARRKFGHEILEYLVSPFVSGVYAGDPEMLSLKAAFPSLDEWERQYGSVLRGAMNSRKGESGPRAALCSFRGGMKTLLEAFTRSLGASLLRGARVDAIERRAEPGSSGYTLRFTEGSQHESANVQAIVIATPAYVAGHLLRALSSRLAELLPGVSYAPVAVVALGYKREQVGNALIGFGFLIPRKEHLRTLGTIWSSSLFPGCAPNGSVLLSSFAGGATDPDIVALEPDFISATIQSEIGEILGISGAPIEKQLWRHSKALPQYNLGHGHIVESVTAELAKIQGIFVTGNYMSGPSIGSCVESSNRAAETVQAFLAGKSAAGTVSPSAN